MIWLTLGRWARSRLPTSLHPVPELHDVTPRRDLVTSALCLCDWSRADQCRHHAQAIHHIIRLLYNSQGFEEILQAVYAKIWQTAASYDTSRGRR